MTARNDWRDAAACRPYPNDDSPYVRIPSRTAEAFFNPASQRARDLAKAVCAHCPVADECLQDSLDAGMQYGIWGGLDEDERRAMRRARIERTAPC